MANNNKRIFDTDNALKGSFNGLCGKWQMITYSMFVFSYAVIIGWISRVLDYNLLTPKFVQCNYSELFNNSLYNITENNIIQRLSGRNKYLIINKENNTEIPFNYTFSNEFGRTIVTDFNLFCDLESAIKAPRFVHFLGSVMGCLLLGFASDKGGRKIIILACIWTAGIMSLFQLVGNDFISFVFFQFFLGLFIGGVQASFLPAIIEMFPINLRAFYGVFFHLVISLFEILLPWLAKSFKSWKLLQVFITAPVVLTAVLQWFVYESIFWYLAYKEYDKAIKVLTRLAKRNGIQFESKFKQAKDFLHAKHSKGTQVELLPLLRLQDVELLGKKYPLVDLTELQKQKANSSKLRRFLNSLKGESYRSTNTIYRPFDFIYSPTLFVYVLILAGLWFTNGLTDSMESKVIKDTFKTNTSDNSVYFYLQKTIAQLTCVVSSSIAIVLALLKCGRRWPIFAAYLVIEVCLLGSLIAEFSSKDDQQTKIALNVMYHFCKFSSHFGFIFLMLITAELFPTSLRCTGFGICFTIKSIGSLIASPDLLNHNETPHRLAYCLLTLFFGSMTLFLPETKSFPLPRSILQIEAMPTTIGKKLRSRKVQLACERRQNQYAANTGDSMNRISLKREDAPKSEQGQLLLPNDKTRPESRVSSKTHDTANTKSASSSKDQLHASNGSNTNSNEDEHNKHYDTVTSVHDIEQDDHHYYPNPNEKQTANSTLNPHSIANSLTNLNMNIKKQLTKIIEVPSKNITRNNSIENLEIANSKL